MTTDATMTAPVGWETPEERQAAARDAYRRSVETGEPLSAAALAARFDRSLRWAQERIAEVRNACSTTGNRRSNGSGADATGSGQRSASAASAGEGAALAADRRAHAARAQRIDTLIVTVVAAVAAVASYEHQRTLASLAGEGDLAYVLPVSVDGMMLATSRSILRRRRAGLRVPFLSWFGFLLGFVASVGANVAAAEPTLVGRVLAAWPPVALFIAYETLAADYGEFQR